VSHTNIALIDSRSGENSVVRLVMVSGGMASFEAAHRVIERYGKTGVHLWFADTLMEDDDLYRFLDDAEHVLGLPIKRMSEGRNPWQVFEDERFIGNSRVDPCSKKLKRQFLRRQLKARFPNQSVTVYLGLDWMEAHRIAAARRYWSEDGYAVGFPLCWEPLLFSKDYTHLVRQQGIEPPRLYAMGFPHNNCGGGCVKAGQKQWALLWHTFPDRYRWHEEQEQHLRRVLGKNVAILRDRRGGTTRPLTLRRFRLRLEQGAGQNHKDEPTIENLAR
jgi:3'-phosphoadenosine 5'-phosphosulfate sulfotransferase (PAPS reductase)/FAD synthetase